MPLSFSGFWGPVTSSVDWCEANYEHSRYVCEFFNTLSSGAMVSAGGAGLWLHRRSLEKRFLLAFFLVCVVGLGSVAFHATLRFEFQMLDELPMLYVALVMVYILLDSRPAGAGRPMLALGLLAWGVVLTALATFTRGRTQFYAFQISFSTLEFFCLYRAYRVYKKTLVASVRRLFRTGASLYLLAIALWLCDLELCGPLSRLRAVPNPQLHAWWHVLVACGLYLLVVAIAFHRAQALGWSPEIRRRFGIPYVRGSSAILALHEEPAKPQA